jgi:hypothetical protein
MKQHYKWASLAFALALFGWGNPSELTAQDTLTVKWLDEQSNVIINGLWTTIAGDTVAGGGRANPNRVYKLERGGFYYLTETIENRGYHLRIVGEKPDPTKPEGNPAVLQIEHRADGGNVEKLIIGQDDVTLKNLYINGRTTKDALPYEVLRFDGAGKRVILDNVVLENAQWAIIGVYGKNSDIYVTNSKFRNLISRDQPWGGRGISVWADVDSVYFENNSFMNVGGFAVQVEGATANTLWFNHNTVVNNGRQLFITGWWQKTFVTNNLFLNPFWHGEDATNLNPERLADPDLATSGLFGIDPLPSQYGLDVQRQIVFANNAYFLQSQFKTYHSTDNDTFPIRTQPLFNGRTSKMFDKWANMVHAGNVEVDPGFTTAPDNQAQMIQNITDMRKANSPVTLYAWDPGRDADPAAISWPLPENFTYSNATLKTAGFGGHPLGDLNWYPSNKATWMAAREQQTAAIKALLSGEVTVNYLGSVEAENAGRTGDATVAAAADKYAVRMQGTGKATWKVNIATAGTYDFVIKLRTWWDDGAADRATDLVINGNSSAFPRGGTGADWTLATVTGKDLVQGENTIELVKNWGYLEYESVTIKQGETTVAVLAAGKAVIADCQLQCSGSACASGDELVTVKNGSLTFGVSAPADGQYVVKFNYRLTEGPSTNPVFNGANELAQVVFGGANNTALQYDLYADLKSGANAIKLDAGTASLTVDKIDYYQVSTAVSAERERPSGFALNQNYPNPFNPATTISFQIPNAARVKLTVFNVLGQQVATLVDNQMNAGMHAVSFDASRLASGMYFYRIEAGSFAATKKMMLVK